MRGFNLEAGAFDAEMANPMALNRLTSDNARQRTVKKRRTENKGVRRQR
jgi:hypothetical protein